jgi:hypothetical protein
MNKYYFISYYDGYDLPDITGAYLLNDLIKIHPVECQAKEIEEYLQSQEDGRIENEEQWKKGNHNYLKPKTSYYPRRTLVSWQEISQEVYDKSIDAFSTIDN